MRSIGSHIRNVISAIAKHKLINFANIIGLAIGFSLSIFMLFYVRYEFRYDRQHDQPEKIFRLYSVGKLGSDSIRSAATPLPSIKLLRGMDSLVEYSTQIIPGSRKLITYEDKSFSEEYFCYSDSSLFKIFKFSFISGDKSLALKDTASVVISNSVARKYFGFENPMGKELSLDNGLELKVTGVYEDMKKDSHLHFDFIASISVIDKLFDKNDSMAIDQWKSNWLLLNSYNYLKLYSENKVHDVEIRFNELKQLELDKQISQAFSATDKQNTQLNFALQPVTSIHLQSNLNNELSSNSSMINIIVTLALALFVLITSIVTFWNLSTSYINELWDDASKRRLLGAGDNAIILNHIINTVLQSIISLFLGIVLLELLFPLLNNYLKLNLHLSDLRTPYDWVFSLLIAIVIGTIVGFIPGLYISKRSKGMWKYSTKNYTNDLQVRGSIVFLHIVFTVTLIIFGIILKVQLHGIQNADLGFTPKDVLIIERGYVIGDKLEQFKNDLKKDSSIISVSACYYLPGDQIGQISVRAGKNDDLFLWNVNFVDCEFFKTMQIKITDGDLSKDFFNDSSYTVVLNKMAFHETEIQNIKDAKLEIIGNKENDDKYFSVDAISNNFYYSDLKNEIEPFIFLPLPGNHFKYIILRFSEGKKTIAEKNIVKTWNQYTQNQPLKVYSLKESMDENYSNEISLSRTILVLSFFSLIMCLMNFSGHIVFYTCLQKNNILTQRLQGASIKFLIIKTISNVRFYVVGGILTIAIFSYFVSHYWLSQFVSIYGIPFGITCLIYLIVIVIFLLISILLLPKLFRQVTFQ